jgi:hypothetical protein
MYLRCSRGAPSIGSWECIMYTCSVYVALLYHCGGAGHGLVEPLGASDQVELRMHAGAIASPELYCELEHLT